MADPDSIEQAEVETTAPAPRASRSRRGVLIGARTATGLVGIAVAVAAIAAASLLPLASVAVTPQSVSVTPVPAAQQLVCPGSVLRLGDESGANATNASALGRPATEYAATSGAPEVTDLAAAEVGGSIGAPTLVSVPSGDDAATTSVAGAQSQAVNSGDYRGLAVAECTQPSSDAWLVGGSTAVGRTTLITLANPGTTVSTITLEVFGENGIVDATGSTGIVVPAASQRVFSLAGFAPSLESPVVHVTSRGGAVVANLQQSVVRGIDPGGVEIIGVTSALATTHVIPGVVILNSLDVQFMLGAEGYADLDTVLRAYVPGTEAAAATVRIVPEGDGATGASFDVTLDPGVVTDVPIEGLEDGSYTVVVESSVALVTSLRASTVADDESDLAWFAAGDALTDSAFVSIAPGAGASLHLSNPGTDDATVQLGDETIPVSAGSSVSVAVASSRSYSIEGAAGLYATVTYAGAGQLATYLLRASATAERPVVITF